MSTNKLRFLNHPRFKMWPPKVQEAAKRGEDHIVKNYLSASSIKGHNTKKVTKAKGVKLTPEESVALKKMQDKYAELYYWKDLPQVNIDKLKRGYDPEAVSLALRDIKPSQIDYQKKKLRKVIKKLKKKARGEMKPLIVSKDNFILDGHHHHRAATKV